MPTYSVIRTRYTRYRSPGSRSCFVKMLLCAVLKISLAMTLPCFIAESRTREDFLLMQMFEQIFAASFDFSRNGVAVVAMPLRVEGISRKRRDWMRLDHVHPDSRKANFGLAATMPCAQVRRKLRSQSLFFVYLGTEIRRFAGTKRIFFIFLWEF